MPFCVTIAFGLIFQILSLPSSLLQLWYLQLPVSVLMGGLLSFGAVFVEMFFIISSIWQVCMRWDCIVAFLAFVCVFTRLQFLSTTLVCVFVSA